jgi:electron transfer flavoprotein alpha subunit
VIAVVPVRGGTLPLGGDETVSECGGRALVVGDGSRQAAEALQVRVVELRAVEVERFAAAALSEALAPLLEREDVVLLPSSPDGRDLGPRLAAVLGRPFWAGAVSVAPGRVSVARYGGRVLVDAELSGPAVVTLVPGAAGLARRPSGDAPAAVESIAVDLPDRHDAETIDVLEPTPETIALAEAKRVFAGGAGLSGPADFDLLARTAAAVGASAGGTRVAADKGWVDFERQIGTTGVTLDAELYVAFGVSGAVQHLAGIGSPEHVVAVNTDPACPMMSIADLALIADAPAVLAELAELLGVTASPARPA